MSKDPAAEPIYDKWFSLIEEGASYSEVADWLNEAGVPTGPYSRSATWTGSMVKRVTFNPIIKGVRERNRRKSRRVNKTGRRRSVIAPPEDLLLRDVPHLAFIERQRYDRVIALLTNRNDMYRRGREGKKDPLENRSKKDTRWPGQSVICGVCGRPYVFGAHGQTNRLMCDGARQHRCWNGISLDAGLACNKILAMVLDGLMELNGFDEALVDKLQQEYAQLDIERIRTVRELEQKLLQVQREKLNILATIREDGGNRTLVNELTRLENCESELELQLTTIRSAKRPDLDLPSIEELRIAARASVSDLPHNSAEFARHMRRLISPLLVFPYRLHDGGHIVLRAEMTLSLVSFLKPHLQDCTAAGPPLSHALVVDTFESPQREVFRNDIVQLTATTDLTEREIADRLVITQPVVQRAKKLQRLLNQLGQTDPYAPITEPPDDYTKLRRHLHKRYRFEPLDGFPRPWPV